LFFDILFGGTVVMVGRIVKSLLEEIPVVIPFMIGENAVSLMMLQVR
jgi:hypothetical protein